MNRRTELITRLLKKSTSVSLTLPADFLDSEIFDLKFTENLNNAIQELSEDAELTVTTSKVEEDYIVEISLKPVNNEEEIEEDP